MRVSYLCDTVLLKKQQTHRHKDRHGNHGRRRLKPTVAHACTASDPERLQYLQKLNKPSAGHQLGVQAESKQ